MRKGGITVALLGMIMIIVGGIGLFGSIYKINNSYGYTWRAPFSDFETMMMALVIISFIIAIVGILLVIFANVKSKNEAKLRNIENIQGVDKNGNVQIKGKCPKCNLNISDDCTHCPRCGQEIRRN